MKCSYCNNEPLFKCACIKAYMCQTHLGEHIATLRGHNYEYLDITFKDSRLRHLHSAINKTLSTLTQAQLNLTQQTKSIIASIKTQYKASLHKLDQVRKDYLDYLIKTKFCESEMQKLKEIEKTRIELNPFDLNDISCKINQVYNQEMFNFKKELSDQNLSFFKHRTGGFRCGAVTQDGKILVTGGTDSKIRVWDLFQKKQKSVLHGHNSRVQCLILIKDSQFIVSGSFDASVRTWNLQQKSQVFVLKGHNYAVYSLCYIETRSWILSGDYGGTLIIWNFTSNTLLHKLKLPGKIFTLTLTKNDFNVILGSNPEIYLYEFETDQILKTFRGHCNSIWSLLFTSDEKKIVSGSGDQSIIIWDYSMSKIIHKLTGHSGGVFSVALSEGEQLIVSGSEDETVRLWNIHRGDQIYLFNNHKYYVYSIMRVGSGFISLSEDSSIGTLDISMGELQINIFIKPFKTNSTNFEKNLGLISYGSNNEAAVWDVEVGADRKVLKGHKSVVEYVEVSQDGKFAISCSQDFHKNLIYWNLETGKKVAHLIGHYNTVFCAALTRDGLFAASGSGDTTVRTWYLREARQDSVFLGHTDYVYTIKFLETRQLLVSAGNDKKVMIWNLGDKSLYCTLSGHIDLIRKVIVTDDEKFVVSGDLLGGIRIWNVDKKRMESSFCYEEQAKNWLSDNRIELDSVKAFLKA